jgi:hypothetical protein
MSGTVAHSRTRMGACFSRFNSHPIGTPGHPERRTVAGSQSASFTHPLWTNSGRPVVPPDGRSGTIPWLFASHTPPCPDSRIRGVGRKRPLPKRGPRYDTRFDVPAQSRRPHHGHRRGRQSIDRFKNSNVYNPCVPSHLERPIRGHAHQSSRPSPFGRSLSRFTVGILTGFAVASLTRRTGAVGEGAIRCVVTEGGSGGGRRRC